MFGRIFPGWRSSREVNEEALPLKMLSTGTLDFLLVRGVISSLVSIGAYFVVETPGHAV